MTSKHRHTGLDDIFEPIGATTTKKNKEELVFHRFSRGSWGSDNSGNVLTFVTPPSPNSTEDAPVQNSLTFEESDRPIRRFPQHLVEIMRRAEQDHRSTRSSPPAPLCGILTINEDSIAWVAVRGQFETTLVMFSANPEKSEVAIPATHVEVEEIVSVCAVAQPSADGANHLIAIATVSGVRLYRLLVCAASIVIDVSTNIFFSIPDVAVTSIVAADTGRLFAGCIDGWVYELQYIDSISSWWRPPKIRKVSPSVSGALPLVALSYLPAPLFIRDRTKNFFSHTLSKQWNHMPVVDMCVHSSCESLEFTSRIRHVILYPAVVMPSKLFLWALEKKEEDDARAPPLGVTTRAAKQYKSALQIYEVHASGLQLLNTFCDHEFKKKHPGTWMSRIFPVEPWQEVQQELTGKHEAVARVCVVLGNGIRLFYKYDHSRKAFSEYGKHSPPVLDRNDDAPCCFFNGRFVRVNRDTSSVTSVFRSSFENAIADDGSYAYIPAVSRLLRCASAAGHRMQTCVVVPVPMPAEIGRLISLQRHPPKSFDQVLPRTVHDAFWQMHSEVQDYLVMFSYGSDRCGITLVREYSLRGRIRQAFRRQDAELYRSAIEDAFLGRSAELSQPQFRTNNPNTIVYQRSLILATQLSLHIDCKISANTSDLKLQEAMFQRINSAVSAVIENNAWRFCVYSVLSPWYRVPLFSQADVAPFKGNSIPTLALRDNHKHGWKYVHDYLQQIIEMSQQRGGRHVFEVESKDSFTNHKIVEALVQVQEITAVLFLLSNLFRRAPPLLVATGIKRRSGSGTIIPPNTVEEFLSSMDDKAHHTLLDDVLDESNFDAHMDQELRDYLRHFCPSYFKEKQFSKAMTSLVIGESALDASFRKVKTSKNKVNLQGVCDSFQQQIVKLMTDNEGFIPDGNFDWPWIRSDMHFCALLLGYSSKEYTNPNVECPEFWHTDAGGMKSSSTTTDLWRRCHLQQPKGLPESGEKLSYPFLFQPPIRYLCSQICRFQKKRIFDDDCLKNAAGMSKSVPQIKISELYQKSLEHLLHLAFNQKKELSQTQFAAVGSKLFENAVEVALSLNDKKCTEIVCNWLDAGPKNSKGGFKPSTVIHTYRDSEPFFAVMATIQYYHHVEEWINDKIVQPKTGSVSSDAAYYCCLLLEYLHIHHRWSDFCAKTLQIVSKKEYIVGLDHKIAWLNAALNCTNGRTLQELPHKFNFVEQIQLRLKVLHLHKLAYDRISNLLTISDSNHSHVKRWAIHFRMFNSSHPLFFNAASGIGLAHTFEDMDHVGTYILGPHLRDSKEGEKRCSSMLGYLQPNVSQGTYENGLLAHYRDCLISGEVSYMDHAFFRKILSNSMFFDLEIMYLHAVMPILNHQEIKKCIEKMMVQSWFNENTTSSSLQHCEGATIPVMDEYPNTHWDDYCMRTDFDENHVDKGWRVDLKRYILPASEVHTAIESLRRRIHSFLEIAPKSQDILRIMFPPEVLVTFACTHIGPHLGCTHTGPHLGSPVILRHYVCAIADILLGYNSPLDARLFKNVLEKRIEDLEAHERPHAFVSYNALVSVSDAIRTKGRDRCISLRNLWDALPHICRNLPDNSRFETVKLGFAARLACETAASKFFGMLQDGPAVDLAMQQYKVHHEHIKRLHPVTPGERWSDAKSLKQIMDLSESWYDIIMKRT